MTNTEAIKILSAKRYCMKRENSGTDVDCNLKNCDECSLCYEQGTSGEQIEALSMAISALKAFGNGSELPNSSDDCISRQAAIDVIEDVETKRLKGDIGMIYAPAIKGLRALPSVQAGSTDNAEFWRKRAKDYENMVINLTAKISKDARLESMEMNAEGLVFKMKEPPVQG